MNDFRNFSLCKKFIFINNNFFLNVKTTFSTTIIPTRTCTIHTIKEQRRRSLAVGRRILLAMVYGHVVTFDEKTLKTKASAWCSILAGFKNLYTAAYERPKAARRFADGRVCWRH